MNGQRTTSKKHQEAGAKSRRWDLWIMTVTAPVLACICALVATVFRVPGERDAIRGSGTIVVENRPVGHFDRVSLGDLGTLIITQGDEEALTVETDDNLLRYVETRVRDGAVVLSLSDGAGGRTVQPSKEITYRLSVRHIVGLEVADSGRIQAPAADLRDLVIRVHDSGGVVVDSLMAHTLKVYLEDSGDVHLAGRVERQEITAQDSGRYVAGQLQSRTATVAASDSAEATLWAMEALNVTVTDSGHVRYYGAPRRTQHLSDNGTLAGLGEP